MEEDLKDNQRITDLLKEYLSTRIELARLTAVNRVVIISANLITDTFVLMSFIISFLFGSVTLGFYLSELLGSYTEGFLIVTGLYMLMGLIMYVIKDKYVEKPVINFMIRRTLRNKRLND